MIMRHYPLKDEMWAKIGFFCKRRFVFKYFKREGDDNKCIRLRNIDNLPFASFVGSDSVKDTFGFQDGEVTLHTFGGYADFFREGAGGVLWIFAEEFYYSIAGLDLFLWLLYRGIFSD